MVRIPLGMAQLYYNPDTGETEYRKSALRTVEGDRDADSLYDPDDGPADIAGDDDDDDEDGDDEDGDDEDGDDEDGDDEDGDEDGDEGGGDESGAAGRRRRRRKGGKARARRRSRRADDLDRRSDALERKADRLRGSKGSGGRKKMKRSRSTAAETLVTQTPTAAGEKMLVELRADETLLIQRVTFSGDDNARLRSIFIGRKSYLNSSNGMKLSEFKATNMQNLNIVGAKVPQGTHVKFEIEASAGLQAVDVNIFGKWISAERC